MSKINGKALLFLVGIIVLQIILSIWACNRNPLHGGDEALSYTFSIREGCYGPGSEMDTWFSSEEYLNSVFAVPEDERFDFSRPYHNSLNDMHPPLYFFLLFFVSSIFAGGFSWWTAISVNIVCMVLTSIFLFLLSRRLLRNDIYALLPVLMWNLTGALYTVRYIRMNALLTTFSVALCWYMVYLIQEGVSIKRLIPLLLISYLGFISQILFTVFAFIVTLTAVLYFFIQKSWKNGLMVGFTMLFSLGLFLLTWPSFLFHVVHTNPYSSTLISEYYPSTPMGRILFTIKYAEVSLSQAFVHNRLLAMILLPILFVTISILLWKKKAYNTDNKRKTVIFFLLSILVFAFIFIGNSLVAPTQPCQYYHLYPFFSLIFAGSVLFFLNAFHLEEKRFSCLYIGIMCIFAVTSFDQYRVSEMSKDKLEIFNEIEDKTSGIEAAIHVAEDGGIGYHEASDIYVLQKYSQVYNTDKNGISNLKSIINEAASGEKVAVYIRDFPEIGKKEQIYYIGEVMDIIENSGAFSEINMVGHFEENTVLVCMK